MSQAQLKDGFDRGDCIIAFGDNVKVRTTPVTEAAGIAGAAAQVMGETTPSVTRVAVIGTPRHDFALAVSISTSRKTLWIDPDLLELLDHGAGTTISIKGVPKEWTRDERGQWHESKVGFLDRVKRWFRRGK